HILLLRHPGAILLLCAACDVLEFASGPHQKIAHPCQVEQVESGFAHLLRDAPLDRLQACAREIGILFGASCSKPELAWAGNVLGCTDPRVVEVAGLVARSRRGAAYGELLDENLGIVERAHLTGNLGGPLPMASRTRDLRV